MPHRPNTLLLVLAVALPLLSTLPQTALSQDSAHSFSSGTYYSTGNIRHIRYRLERNGDTEKDLNLENGDSSLWRMRWIDSTTYTLEYINGNDPLMKDKYGFMKKHKLAFRIDSVTADYYTYSSFLDKVTSLPILKDTVWLHEIPAVGYTPLFLPVTSTAELQNLHFSDASPCALLCIYRPGKTTNSFSDFYVYGNDRMLWVARNRSGTVLRVQREGEITLTSRELKDSASVKVNIRFGNIYFVKAMVHWGMYKRGNYHLEIVSVPPDQGAKEFDALGR